MQVFVPRDIGTQRELRSRAPTEPFTAKVKRGLILCGNVKHGGTPPTSETRSLDLDGIVQLREKQAHGVQQQCKTPTSRTTISIDTHIPDDGR